MNQESPELRQLDVAGLVHRRFELRHDAGRDEIGQADAEAVAKFAGIGIVPGQDFDKSKLDAAFVSRIPVTAFHRIMLHFKFSDGDVQNINGWGFTTKTGIYGTGYLQRALITAIGLGANRPHDAIYPTSLKSKDGLFARAYHGANKYVVTFPKGQLPPVRGFWSITMYDDKYFFVDNPLNRYSISARQDLKTNPDGSTDIYIQNESPGADKESNWLPAPDGPMAVVMRLYLPEPQALDGRWKPPPIETLSRR